MRTKRFLLVTAALTTTMACGKDAAKPETSQTDAETLPLPANPKGSFYDAGIEATPPPPPPPPPPPTTDAGPVIRRLPANPKGSHYDAGKKPTTPF